MAYTTLNKMASVVINNLIICPMLCCSNGTDKNINSAHVRPSSSWAPVLCTRCTVHCYVATGFYSTFVKYDSSWQWCLPGPYHRLELYTPQLSSARKHPDNNTEERVRSPTKYKI